MRGRLLGMLAFPILVAQCGPPQCAPEPPAPAPVTTQAPTTTAAATPPVVTNPPAPPVGSWSFLDGDGARYTRWSICGGPITYQIDATVPPTAEERAALDAALRAASAATGHSFVYAGDAGATPLPGVEAVLGVKDFPANVLGETVVRFDPASYELSAGSAYVDVGLASDLLVAALLHEIAHLLGLGHVNDQAQLLFPYALQKSVTPPRFLQAYQPGDLEGLRLVGTTVQSGPCQARLRVTGDEVHEITIN